MRSVSHARTLRGVAMKLMDHDTALDLEHTVFNTAAFAASALRSRESLAAVFDHTLLKPDATREQIVTLCHEAGEHRFACAMVNPTWVPLACSVLEGSGV